MEPSKSKKMETLNITKGSYVTFTTLSSATPSFSGQSGLNGKTSTCEGFVCAILPNGGYAVLIAYDGSFVRHNVPASRIVSTTFSNPAMADALRYMFNKTARHYDVIPA